MVVDSHLWSWVMCNIAIVLDSAALVLPNGKILSIMLLKDVYTVYCFDTACVMSHCHLCRMSLQLAVFILL
uniref:Uncharacterized protein n=1 Tax=Arundo donax TaxID=35708 RepID=A0A0A9DCV9_ARUDO